MNALMKFNVSEKKVIFKVLKKGTDLALKFYRAFQH